jgi:hypothetical protein
MNVPSTVIQALEAELQALGLRLSDLNDDSALRALILHRNNIPLTLEMLTDAFEKEDMVFNRLDSLRESVFSLLADKRFSGEIRTALVKLVSDIDSLFKTELVQGSLRSALEDSIFVWSRTLESQLLRLLTGDLSTVPEILAAHVEGSGFAREAYSILFEAINNNPRLAEIFGKLGSATGEVLSQIQGIKTGSEDIGGTIRQAAAALEQRLTALAPEITGFLQGRGAEGLTEGIVAGFLMEHVQTLERILQRKAAGSTTDSEANIVWGNEEVPLPLRNMLRSSGMAFEWRLLAWYRSGRDPALLRELMYRDIKGILTGFTSRLKHPDVKGHGRKALDTLGEEAHSILDSISRRQISAVLHGKDSRQGMYFEIPFGEDTGRGNARIWADGRKKPEGDTLDPGDFHVSFDVETTNLGRVMVSMNAVDFMVSLRFIMTDERCVDLARQMQDELAGSLRERGFRVGSVTVDMRKDDDERARTPHFRRNLDIVG